MLGKSMFHGMRAKELENWIHENVAEQYMFGVCQQGMGKLWRLRASAQLPTVQLPPVAAVEAVRARMAALAEAQPADEDDEDL